MTIGYEKIKQRRQSKNVAINRAEKMSFKTSDIDWDFKIERHPVGDGGHFLQQISTDGNGREKWQIHDAMGQPVGAIWGKAAAMAACKQLIDEGVIVRD